MGQFLNKRIYAHWEQCKLKLSSDMNTQYLRSWMGG
jgi:hypothetical protein